jgi:hemoglobin/transferrin/lactoferrin receptor protein
MSTRYIALSFINIFFLFPNSSFAQEEKKEKEENVVELPTIEVKAKETKIMGSKKKRDDFGTDINTTIRDMSGVFTQHTIGQGGVSVNIRGLSGFGRVNTTIDGVSQTFFQNNPHGSNGNTTFIDENFISTVESSKGGLTGTNGTNALAGAFDFKTIDPDDIIFEGSKFGSKVSSRLGSNGYGHNESIAAALKHEFNENVKLSLITAISENRKYGYKNAAGEKIASDKNDDTVAMQSGSKSRSYLNKAQLELNDFHKFNVSNISSENDFINNTSPLNVKTNLSLFSYNYDSLSDLINIKLLHSINNTDQKFLGNSMLSGSTITNKSSGSSIENKSLFEFSNFDLESVYGFKLLKNDYDSNNKENMIFKGNQKIESFFLDNKLDVSNFSLKFGIRQENYQIKGYIPSVEYEQTNNVHHGKGGENFTNNESHVNPYFNVTYSVNDWLDIYASYAHSSRSPNVNEVMYSGNSKQPLSVNPFLKGEQSKNFDVGFSLNKNDLFIGHDTLSLNTNFYRNRVKNYILQDQFYICDRTDVIELCGINDPDLETAFGLYRNITNTTEMHGVEIDLRYDFDVGYLSASYTKSKANFPYDRLADMGFSNISNLPSSYWHTEIAGRFLDKKILTGFKFSYTGEDSVANGLDFETDQQTIRKTIPNPILVDFFAKYQVNKNMQLFLSVENLTNKLYNYPVSFGTLGTGNTSGDDDANKGTGRGRTYFGGVSFRL